MDILFLYAINLARIMGDCFTTALTSWSAVVLIVSLIILLRHHKAVDELIGRIVSLGKDGAKFDPPKATEVAAEPRERPREAALGIAIVTCEIASQLPETPVFNFLDDWKVWFLIQNHDQRQYLAFVSIEFIAGDYSYKVQGGHYGGVESWKLNALTGIRAPGLDIPEEIRIAARARRIIKIKISCTIKDVPGQLIEEKLPSVYVYEYNSNYWYLEP